MEQALTRQAYAIARIIQAILNTQKPFSKNVKVRPFVSGTQILFYYEEPDYGTYLDLGTGRYHKPASRRGKWNPSPGEGTDGIKPRFWKSLPEGIKQRIGRMMADAITKEINKELAKAFKK